MRAHQNRRQWEFGGTMVAIYQGASAVDQEAATEISEALRGRRWILDQFVEEMKDALRPDLDVDWAVAILRALCQQEFYRELVDESGWSPDEYELWLGETLKEQQLSPGALS